MAGSSCGSPRSAATPIRRHERPSAHDRRRLLRRTVQLEKMNVREVGTLPSLRLGRGSFRSQDGHADRGPSSRREPLPNLAGAMAIADYWTTC
jgi:hypothetical protein